MSENVNINEQFYAELSEYMKDAGEASTKQIYSLFPHTNPQTLSWRLHKLVQEGKLFRTERGYYTTIKIQEPFPPLYDYLQKKTQKVYDKIIEYGYDFYVTGLDSLSIEMLHIPEKYPTLLVVEREGIEYIQDILVSNDFFVFSEKERNIIIKPTVKHKIDVILLNGKDFIFDVGHIAEREKAFIDLYYAVTRLDYSVSVPELSRIYSNLMRTRSLAVTKMKKAAKDRGITTEINWLIESSKLPEKAWEFMSYHAQEK